MTSPSPAHRLLARLPASDRRIVSMVEHEGRVLVATEQRVYQLEGDRLLPIKFRKTMYERRDR